MILLLYTTEFAVIIIHRSYKGLLQKLGIVISILQKGKWRQRAVKFSFESRLTGQSWEWDMSPMLFTSYATRMEE